MPIFFISLQRDEHITRLLRRFKLPSSCVYYVLVRHQFPLCSYTLLAIVNVKSCSVSLKTLGKVVNAAIYFYQSQESRLHNFLSAMNGTCEIEDKSWISLLSYSLKTMF